jgi:CheY-like chemotaxis protein
MRSSQTTLLVVDDNELDVYMLQRLLRRMSLDCPVVHARNGEHALELLRPADGDPTLVPPFIMFLDINMPRMSGFELLDELEGDQVLCSVPIFIVSTSTRPQDQRKAAEYSVRGYMVKPLSEEMLRDILETPGAATSASATRDPHA